MAIKNQIQLAFLLGRTDLCRARFPRRLGVRAFGD